VALVKVQNLFIFWETKWAEERLEELRYELQDLKYRRR